MQLLQLFWSVTSRGLFQTAVPGMRLCGSFRGKWHGGVPVVWCQERACSPSGRQRLPLAQMPPKRWCLAVTVSFTAACQQQVTVEHLA